MVFFVSEAIMENKTIPNISRTDRFFDRRNLKNSHIYPKKKTIESESFAIEQIITGKTGNIAKKTTTMKHKIELAPK